MLYYWPSNRQVSHLLAWVCLGLLLTSSAAAEEPVKVGGTLGKVESLDAAFDALVPPGSKIEVLADGFDWSEGPVWVKEGGFLLFSDIPPNRIMKFDPQSGLSIFMEGSGYTGSGQYSGEPGSNGLLIDKQGRLVMCQHGNRRVARLASLDPKAEQQVIASEYEGKKLNSPNDAVFHSNGDLYFTDPPYGLPKQADDPIREIDFCGVYRVTPEGRVTLITDKMTRPNGIGLSPDQKKLYVAQSDNRAPIWNVFNLKEDGTADEGSLFYDARQLPLSKPPGGPDGLKLDKSGNLWATGPGGVIVISPEGKPLGRITTGVATANCGWGDDGKTLYMTADMYLCRIKTNAVGQGF